jgi:hypothetical protein
MTKQVGVDRNILITFNLKDIVKKGYSSHLSFPKLESSFDQVIRIDRSDECKNKIYTPTFLKYYRKKMVEYEDYIRKIGPIDTVYFFSDYEMPVEMLISKIKELKSPLCILVDEGLASYHRLNWKPYRFKLYLIEILKKVFQIKLNSRGYGQSNLYDKSFALRPDLCVFHGYIEKLGRLNDKILNNSLDTISFVPSASGYIYISCCINAPIIGVSKETEISVLLQLQQVLNSKGLELFIKPHPTQSRSYYSDFAEHVLDSSSPAELMFRSHLGIISPFSSTLINSHILGINALCIAPLFGIATVDLSIFRKFGISIVNDLNEFEAQISIKI